MTKRVLGVLAALTMVVGSVACSSSTTDATPAKDTGTGSDAKSDSGSDVVVVPGDSDTDSAVPTDKTTGLQCMTDEDCDKTGNGVAHCTSTTPYYVGPVNPTAVCWQYDSSGADVCTATDDTTISFCDNGLGLCSTKPAAGMGGTTCDPMCVLGADGTWVQKCAGKNGCSPNVFGNDSSMKINMIGNCQGGCVADADCPSGSKCDPIEKICTIACTSDTQCATKWPTSKGAPAAWKCDTARGACSFIYPKKLGDTCTVKEDCPCFKNTADTSGYCIKLCVTGEDCGSGYSCDALLPAKDTTGAAAFTFTAQPTGIEGYCLKNCSADTDCISGQVCEASAGLTQKTCKPKSTPAATDGGAG